MMFRSIAWRDRIFLFWLCIVVVVQGGPSVRRELDTNLDTIFDVATPSPQHNVKRNTFKAVFPTDPRDFVLMQWWEAQPDGSLRTYVTSVKDDKLAPEVKGFVRGTMDIAGWVITPISAQASDAAWLLYAGTPKPINCTAASSHLSAGVSESPSFWIGTKRRSLDRQRFANFIHVSHLDRWRCTKDADSARHCSSVAAATARQQTHVEADC
jgi:hypothetical protein